jgi:hypothetical protein
MAGFVYIMSNEAFKEGLLKIGMSSSDPTEFRSHDLYTTGVPSPFKVEYFAFVNDHERIEKIIHKRLEHKRPNYQREFFSCTVAEAIILIRESASIHYEKVLYKSPEEVENERKRQEWLKKKNQEILERQAAERERETQRKRAEEERIKLQKKDEFIGEIKSGVVRTTKVVIGIAGLIALMALSISSPNWGMVFILIYGAAMIYWLWED